MDPSKGPSDGFLNLLEQLFAGYLVKPLTAVIFFDVAFWDDGAGDAIQIPLVVLWLVLGAVFFTLRFQFVNFRGFRHAVDCVRGRYTRPDEMGEISHYQPMREVPTMTGPLILPGRSLREQIIIRSISIQVISQKLTGV